MVISVKEKIDTSEAANSSPREFYEAKTLSFIGFDPDYDVQEQAFTKADFEQDLRKVSRKTKK